MPRRQESVLDRLVADRVISAEGRSFLIAALDPFHDSEIRVAGFPDITSSRSVVQVVPFTKTITKPVGLPAGPWDLHLSNMPTSADLSLVPSGSLGPRTMSTTGRIANRLAVPAISTGFFAVATPSGVQWNAGNSVSTGLELPASYSTGSHRLLGFGYEAVNTTAPLYQSGSVTTYKAPAPAIKVVTCEPSTVGSPITATSLCDVIDAPPQTAPQAASFPNSRTWAAADGVYSVATLNNIQCPVIDSSPGSVFVRESELPVAGLYSGWGCFPGDASRAHAYPFDLSGSIFTGLSEQSAITVTVKYIIERFPSLDEPDLLVLGSPSPAYDPMVLELYSRCLEHLPAAVPVGENPLGEWFAKVLNTVAKYAPAVASVLPHPLASAIVSGAGRVAGYVGNKLASKSSDTNRASDQRATSRRSGPTIEELPDDAPVRPQASTRTRTITSRPQRARSSNYVPTTSGVRAARRRGRLAARR